MRRPRQGERAEKLEARYIPDGAAVDATGIWHEGHASYPGKSTALPDPFGERVLPASRGVGMGRQMTAEAVVVARHRRGEGPNMMRGEEPVLRDDRRHRQRG